MTEKKLEVILPKSDEDIARCDQLRAEGKLVTDEDYPSGPKLEDDAKVEVAN